MITVEFTPNRLIDTRWKCFYTQKYPNSIILARFVHFKSSICQPMFFWIFFHLMILQSFTILFTHSMFDNSKSISHKFHAYEILCKFCWHTSLCFDCFKLKVRRESNGTILIFERSLFDLHIDTCIVLTENFSVRVCECVKIEAEWLYIKDDEDDRLNLLAKINNARLLEPDWKLYSLISILFKQMYVAYPITPNALK